MRRIGGVLARLALLGAFVPAALGAQEPRIRAEVDTTAVTVGGRVELTITVEHAPSSAVLWPDSLDLRPFEVLDAVALPSAQSEGRTFSAVRLSLAAFELGELEIPSIEIRVVGPDSVVTALSTDPFGIGVVSVGLDEGGNIREIRGPLAIPRNLVLLLPWLLLGTGLLALAYWMYRRRAGEEPTTDRGRVVLPGLPHEDAYDALDRLERAGLLERGEIKVYHIRVSEIIRTYVEGRFEVYALEMSTAEVLEGLGLRDLDAEVLGAFEAFLDRCDLVKFAKLEPNVEACLEVLAVARRLVDETKPRPVLFEIDPAAGAESPIGMGAGTGAG